MSKKNVCEQMTFKLMKINVNKAMRGRGRKRTTFHPWEDQMSGPFDGKGHKKLTG